MLFDTFQYWPFLAAVLVLTWLAPRRTASMVLVIASYAFYAAWDPRFMLLLFASTAINFGFGLAIESRRVLAGKLWVTSAIAANLGILGFFKYYNFFIESFAAIFSLDPQSATLRIVLPVGVSFFTFEGIAYCVDVYRRNLPATRSPLDFALFMAFFPHLVAGPIIRPRDFLPQLGQKAALDEAAVRWSVAQILKGLFKKMVLADALGPIADACFAAPGASASPPVWVGVLAFSLQIYCDFAGYTDIARGSARLLGFSFPSNFERPYLAQNITQFWRRWHISLSTWLRDYLYIPLGGNRLGESRTYLNLITVMGLGGLWHGASWNFVLWGFVHGLMLAVHRFGTRVSWGPSAPSWSRGLLAAAGVAGTFVLVSLAWIPFRAADFATTLVMLEMLPTSLTGASVREWRGIVFLTAGLGVFCVLDRDRRLQCWLIERAPWWIAASVSGFVLWLLAALARTDHKVPFIYFQF